jgi:hypothetical protein
MACIDTLKEKNESFCYCCEKGYIYMAKWIHRLGGVNIHDNDDRAFRRSCEFDHLEIAKWLYSIGANIHAHNDRAFRRSCRYGNYEMAKWLCSIGIDINIQPNRTFKVPCFYLLVLQDHEPLHAYCGHDEVQNYLLGLIKVIKWLSTLRDEWFYVMKDNKLITCSFDERH